MHQGFDKAVRFVRGLGERAPEIARAMRQGGEQLQQAGAMLDAASRAQAPLRAAWDAVKEGRVEVQFGPDGLRVNLRPGRAGR